MVHVAHPWRTSPVSFHALHRGHHPLHVRHTPRTTTHLLHHVHDVGRAAHLLEHAWIHRLLDLGHALVRVALHLLRHVLVASTHHTRLAHLLHHTLELLVALQQHRHLLRGRATAERYPLDSHRLLVEVYAAVELSVGHRVHHVHELFETVRRVLIARHARHAGREARDHTHDLTEWAQLHHILELLVHVAQSELALRHPLHHLHLPLSVGPNGLFDSLDQTTHVTHA
mmetsp:Transcript_91195/g.260454  ORF Transcript_91195/g.260454 Transcript_91195/m.260454 type:complete len:228 (+) Transcript_91195:175-858(+)